MADAVDSTVLFSGSQRYAVRLTNISDGTGESGVVKVDKSALGANKLAIEEIEWGIQGFDYVALYFDHDTDDEAAVLSGNGYKDYRGFGGLVDPNSTGGTGDIILTTGGAAAGASYDITLHVKLK